MDKAESRKHEAIETSLMGTNGENALCHSLFSISSSLQRKTKETNLKKEMGDSYSFRESDNAKKTY